MFNNNYFKVAFRSIMKTKLFTLLSIISLCIGILGAILIFLYTYNELNYDSYHKKSDRIYRINSNFNINEKEDFFALASFPIGYLFKRDYPEVKEFVRLQKMPGKFYLAKDDIKTFVNQVFYADSSLLDIFTHEFIYGEKETALSSFESIMLAESVSDKIFGDRNPIGEIVTDISGITYKVTGVFKDFPDNVHLRYDVIMPMEPAIQLTAEQRGPEAVDPNNTNLLWQINQYCYILLDERANITDLNEKIQGFYDKYMSEIGKQINSSFKPILTSLKETHFTSFQWDEPQGKMEYIYIFIFVSIFLLIIAAINYVNLTTACSMKRAKEVGIRKVLGAHQKQLIKQFLIESIMISFISLFFSMLLIELILPIFNDLTGKNLSFGFQAPLIIYIFILLITISIGLISGIYPAFVLSSFKPIAVLKGEFTKSKRAVVIRKTLVVFQYILSIVMITGTLIVVKQLNYLRNYDLGFDKTNILVVSAETQAGYTQKYKAFKNEILTHPQIKNIATANQVFLKGLGKLVFSVFDEGEIRNLGFNLVSVDADFFDVMGIPFLEGNTFESTEGQNNQSNFNEDGNINKFVMNETASKIAGWKGTLRQISLGDSENPGEVIGVVKDFHYASLHNPIEPLIFIPNNNHQLQIHLKLLDKDIRNTLDFIEKTWYEHFLTTPFEYEFMDSSIDSMYQSEVKLSKVFSYFAIMCIFISCLGIIGLAIFSTEQRTKEIGIRKILGASKYSILLMLNAEFTKLVFVAGILSVPIAYFSMNLWLKNFTYKIDFPFTILGISFVIAWVIAWLTVSAVTYKISVSKPVDAIRYE
jgi:putative ABC transport system permease protein